ncbi:MAG TPA: bifunctional hydroxymethylpyrimidine kinase/phosphomethylpyrimidine kinase [Candidatus Angelobacter sp.]|nr:bifunctional hydroxymethylpyrimidine kinase/phosphomethylpyrimidine kinase [Candidatus Angelobacter sp.]
MRKTLPVALTIAGSDSGGGAGIQADLKTFAALGVHGTSAITCVTAQNPKRVRDIQTCDPAVVRWQIEAVFEELPPAAVKTGMLFSPVIVRVVADFFKLRKSPPLIVDPVLVATSGAGLISAAALRVVQSQLLPIARLVAPNLHETAVLVGRPIRSVEDMRRAARQIKSRFGCAALVKGGHLRGGKEAVDIFYDGKTELLLAAPFVKGVSTHGTGCAYSAAIAGYLALGCDLTRAVGRAKRYVTGAIAGSAIAGGHAVLNHFWERAP